MPQRQLKPGLITSLRFNHVSVWAQNLYVRLISLVDDFGRYDAHPLILSRSAFPYGDPKGRVVPEAKIEEWLAELESCRTNGSDLPLLSRYLASGRPCLVLHRWTERVRSCHSRYPAPPFEQKLSFASRLAESSPNCGQMSANAGTCQQMLSEDAVPSSSSSSTSTTVQGNNKGGQNLAGVKGSAIQWAALSAWVKAQEARVGELTAGEREELRKKRGELRALEKKQREGKFE
jgi:hypothetical protein